MPNNIRAIIFDMGGVVLLTGDFEPRKKLAEELGVSLEKLTDEVFNSESAIRSELGEFTKIPHWQNVLRSFGIERNDIEEIDNRFWSGDYLDLELIAYIRELKKHYRVGFLSNAFVGAREYVEEHFHFLNNFDLTIFSYEVKLRKPNPEVYLLVCEKLRVKPDQAVFVDDLIVNVEGALKAGLQAIQFQNRSQLFRDFSILLKDN